MAENSKNSTNNDILSGKGLKPLPSSKPTPKKSKKTTKKGGQDSSGIRIDRFTKDSGKRG